MGSIVSTGIGSNIDIDSLVTRLVQAEGQAPSVRLATREAQIQARISGLGSFRSAVTALRTALQPLVSLDRFLARSATLSSPDYLRVTADSDAAAGSYAIEVVRLVQADKLQSQAFAGGRDTVVGTGTLTLEVNGRSAAIVIGSGNQTLAGIRDAINAASDNPGVTATIVTANDGARLVLTGNTPGADYAIRVTSADLALQPLVFDPGVTENLTRTQAAQDARILIDGNAVDSATNVFADAIDGVTITATRANASGETTALAVGLDRAGAKKAVEDFVKAYNTLVTSVRGLSAYDAAAKTGGPLLGDSTLRDFNANLRRELQGQTLAAPPAFRQLAAIGVTAKLDGTLEINATRLDAALAGDFAAVGQLFAADGGLARRLDALAGQYVGTDGLIDVRTRGLQSSIADIAGQREALNARLVAVEARLRKQFNAMDTLVAQLRNTSDFLTRQLAALTPTNSGN